MLVTVMKWPGQSSLVRKLGEDPDYHRRLRFPPAEQKDQEGEGQFLKISDEHAPLQLLIILFFIIFIFIFICGSCAVVLVPGAVG